MTCAPVVWRPASDRDPNDARALFDAALADWQSRWFVQPRFAFGEIVRLSGNPPETDASGETRHLCASGVRLDMHARSDRHLIDAAFAAGHAFDTRACHGFLASIATEIRDDLIASVGAALSPGRIADETFATAEHSFSGYGVVRLTIVASHGAALASLFCDIRHLWLRATSNRALAPVRDVDMTPRRAALDACPIALSVLLGRCDLTAAQLTTLSPGDVIVLDHPIDAPATLVVDETSAAVAFGTPGRTGTSLSFKLTSLATPDSP